MKARMVVIVSLLFLATGCNDRHTPPPTAGGGTKPTSDPTSQAEHRELNDEIRKVLGVGEAALVVAFDYDGKVFLYDADAKEVRLPITATEINNLYSLTVLTYKGSHCVIKTDTLGYQRQFCAPPQYHK
jgi:hypothetical protein